MKTLRVFKLYLFQLHMACSIKGSWQIMEEHDRTNMTDFLSDRADAVHPKNNVTL